LYLFSSILSPLLFIHYYFLYHSILIYLFTISLSLFPPLSFPLFPACLYIISLWLFLASFLSSVFLFISFFLFFHFHFSLSTNIYPLSFPSFSFQLVSPFPHPTVS
jgi:hypothetical protein